MFTLLLAAFAGTPVPSNPALEVEEPRAAATGTVLFDARMPVEVQLDGEIIGQLFTASRLSVDTSVGTREVTVVTNGQARVLAIDVSTSHKTVVLIGRNGLTSSNVAHTEDLTGDAPIELRAAGNQDVLVTIGDQRWHVDADGSMVVMVPVGQHAMTVRSGDGHVLWARGRIDLTRAAEVIVQLSEGRLPEVSGTGAAFHPGR